jgi:peptidoglycan hydrolase-like protein with peptidoglycan-binding domain
MPSRPPHSIDARPWLPAIAAGLVLAMVIGIGVFLGGNGTNVGAEPSTLETTPASDRNGIIAPVTTTTPPVIAPTAPPLAAPISLGSAGEDVRRVQERLAQLGFQPGPADGQFGTGTQQAVWAFKKLVGDVAWEEFAARDDQTVVTDDVWQQMADPSVRFLPRRPGSGTHVEIYLPLQVMAVFRDDVPIFISHISSGELRPDGEPATFCETATYDTDENGNTYPEPVTKQVCAEAKSPGGVFLLPSISRRQPGQPARGDEEPVVFQLRHRHPRRAERSDPAGVARLHPDLQLARRRVPRSRPARRRRVRVGPRRQGTRAVQRTRIVAVVQPSGPQRHHDHDVDHVDHDHDDHDASSGHDRSPTTAAAPTTVATTQPPASTTPSTTTTIVP